MKLLKIDNKKCFFSQDGKTFESISDIAKEDIYAILKAIYNEETIELDMCNESTEILNDVEKLIYSNLYNQLNAFIQNKQVLVQEIDNELQEVIDKYKE